jgi:hypothetical protein
MALPAVVVGIASAIAAAPEVINGIEEALHKFLGRSIMFEVTNTLGEPLRVEFDGDGHSSGGFSHPPPHMIAPMSTAVFASRSVGDLRGSLRLVGNDVWFGFSFGNPLVGSNYLRSSVNGRRASEFKVHAVAGKGDRGARFNYVAYYSDLQRVAQEYKAHTEKQSGRSPSVTGKPVKAIGRPKPKKKVPPNQSSDRLDPTRPAGPLLGQSRPPKK